VCGLWVAFTFSSRARATKLRLAAPVAGSGVSGAEIYATFGQSKLCIKKPGQVKPAFDDEVLKNI